MGIIWPLVEIGLNNLPKYRPRLQQPYIWLSFARNIFQLVFFFLFKWCKAWDFEHFEFVLLGLNSSSNILNLSLVLCTLDEARWGRKWNFSFYLSYLLPIPFGVIHKLRWQDLAHYWPPTKPLLPFVKNSFWKIRENLHKGPFTNYVDKISSCWPPNPLPWHFLWCCLEKKWTFLDHLPTLSCQRSLWMPPSHIFSFFAQSDENQRKGAKAIARSR